MFWAGTHERLFGGAPAYGDALLLLCGGFAAGVMGFSMSTGGALWMGQAFGRRWE